MGYGTAVWGKVRIGASRCVMAGKVWHGESWSGMTGLAGTVRRVVFGRFKVWRVEVWIRQAGFVELRSGETGLSRRVWQAW